MSWFYKFLKKRQINISQQQIRQFPYNCIVAIQIFFGPGIKSSLTGFLIAPDLVLTTAHCFLSEKEKFGQIKSITVSYGGGQVKVSTSSVRINDDYLKWAKLQTNELKKEQIEVEKKIHTLLLAKMDFALIRLPSKIARKQYFVLEKITSHDQEEVALCGYIFQNDFKLCEDRNRIKIKGDIGFYKIDTCPGQDGSPIFLTKQNNRVVGIHKGFAKIQEVSYCCPVTDYLVQGVQKLKKQLNTSVNQLDQYKNQSQVSYLRANFQFQDQQQFQPHNEQQFEELKGMQLKASFQGLKFLQLKEQVMKENYVEQLCKCQFSALKEIKLDNDISLAGVVQLVFNEWNKQVKYILDSVRTNDGGYVLNVGQNIPIIKKLIKDRKNINHDAIDSMNDSKELYEALYLMMEMPFEGKEQQVAKESAMFQQKMKKVIESNKDSVSIERLFLTLKQQLGDSRVTFTCQSNIKSQLTWRILTLQMMHKRVMIKHKIKDPRWQFKQFQKNSKEIMKFQQWYLERLPSSCNKKDLRIHKLMEGCIEVMQSVSHGNQILTDAKFANMQKITIIPFFSSFNLSPQDFDPGYNYQYDDVDSVNHLQRGGIPFYQPIRCQKYAIKVQDLYDAATNDWLENQHPNQWGVAFHGINYPDNIVPATNQTVLEAIMSGRTKGQMLTKGQRQACASDIVMNRQMHHKKNDPSQPEQQVGQGIYVSPYFTTSLLGYTYPVQKAGKNYRVVLMARFKPQALKITSTPQYWVINKSRDIRPYAILLFTPQQYRVLAQLEDNIYEIDNQDMEKLQVCHWENWKERYFEFRRQHHLD